MPRTSGGLGDTGPRSRWRWARRAIVGLLGLVLAAVLVGAGYEAASRRRDERRFRPRGLLVDLGSRRLHLHCTGTGAPIVVFDAGLGLPALLWSEVQPGVAAFTTACSFDRAGMGFSDAGPLPRTLDRQVDDLHAALAVAGRPAPYVLVGHSAGGLTARAFQHRFPAEVAGVVLVDAAHEGQFARGPARLAATMRAEQGQLGLAEVLLPLGLPRLLLSGAARRAAPSPEVADELVARALRPAALQALRSEGEVLVGGVTVPADASLGDLPLVVLTAGQAEAFGGLPPAEAAAFRRLWIEELQPELARLSTRGRQVTVEGSGHLMPWQAPRAVVEAVREVVDAVRSQGRPP